MWERELVMCKNNLNDDTIDKMFRENMEKLAKEVRKPSKKENRLTVIHFVIEVITLFIIYTFCKYPDFPFWFKYILTTILIVFCCKSGYEAGLESGINIARKTAEVKDEFARQIIDKISKQKE